MAVRGVLVAQGPQVKPAGDATSVPVVVVVVNAPTTLVPSPPNSPIRPFAGRLSRSCVFLGTLRPADCWAGGLNCSLNRATKEPEGKQGRSQARTRRREMEARNSLS
jgi:hypothetical protein